jgi:hypothetical protein
MSKMRSSAVWLAEVLCEAVGTALWMVLLARITFGPDHSQGHYPYGWPGALVGMSGMVLIAFALTGYLLTTLLAALFVPHRQKYTYPVVCFSLYLIHSEIYFVALGNRMFKSRFLVGIQVGGARLAFAITLAADRFRRSGLPHT